MSTPTYEKIQHIELGTAQATIEFTSVPATFTDLVVVFSLRSNTSGNTEFYLKLNNTNPTQRHLRGNGSTTLSNTDAFLLAPASGQTASTFGNGQIYIPNYTSTNQKSASVDNVTENNGTTAFQSILAANYNVTTAVTSIQITDIYGQWVAGSSATLYGIKSIPSAPKATGGIISYVNGYWVHTFTSSGTFTPTQNLSNVEYLVVAGGGAGGGVTGGGGGAGGYRSSVVGESSGGGASAESRISLTSSTNYTVTIGAGGTGSSGTGANGSNSSLSGSGLTTITATGGGGGGSNIATTNGSSGGSGGGGAAAAGVSTGGSGTANQGYAGGNSRIGSGGGGSLDPYSSGGGGGAAAVGANGSVSESGDGGAGLSSSITGSAVQRAGGGGGGSDYFRAPGTQGEGSFGGGNGGDNGAGFAASPNTGAGGGGGSNRPGNELGGNGASGIVVLRYQ